MGEDSEIMAEPRKHAELIKAWADGAEVEQGIKTADGKIYWTTPKLVTWRDNQIYRIKNTKAQEK
jgi:hypothetical protein